jgi:hypothetical protein
MHGVFDRVYGHDDPDFLAAAVNAFSNLLTNPKYWLDRAEEIRVLAECGVHAETKACWGDDRRAFRRVGAYPTQMKKGLNSDSG